MSQKTSVTLDDLEELFAIDQDTTAALRETLLEWFEANQRSLPWRETSDPYAIWVSEIMLQQTQVATVKSYYERWMELFPDVDTLAQASIEEVLDVWAGLGYYRRAKFLHRGAREVVDNLDGQIPDSAKGLKKLPGIGPYTAGAIASIAYGEAAPLVDGNVERVFARLFAIEGDPKTTANQKSFWKIAETLVDPTSPGDFNQSLMELGATVCTPKKPTCLLCPVRERCQGFATGEPTQFPATVKRSKPKKVSVASLVICADAAGEGEGEGEGEGAQVFLVRRPEEGLLAGLLEFPTTEHVPRKSVTEAFDWRARIDAALKSIEVSLPEDSALTPLGVATHTFSHIKMELHAFLLILEGGVDALVLGDDFARERGWYAVDSLSDAALSSAQRKVEALFLKHAAGETD